MRGVNHTNFNWVVIMRVKRACKYFRMCCFAYQNIWVSGVANPFYGLFASRGMLISLWWRVCRKNSKKKKLKMLQGPDWEQHHLRSQGRPGRTGHSGGTVSDTVKIIGPARY